MLHNIYRLSANGFEVQMALHHRHKEDPFETYDLKKKRPSRFSRRKLRSIFSANFSIGKWASVAVPVIAFALLVSVFVVKIITDSRSVSDEQFRNENPIEVKENIARIQRDMGALPEIEEVQETEASTTETEIDTTAETEAEAEAFSLPAAPEAVVLEPETTAGISVKEYLYVASSTVNVREEASTDSEIIGQVAFNQKLEKLGQKADFIEILTADGLRGYVHQDLLSSVLSDAIVPGMDMYVQVGQAYIRSGAGTDYDIIGFGFKGTRLTVVEAGAEWSMIRTETGLRGYMLNELFGTRKVEQLRESVETNAVRYINYDVVYMREKPTVDSEKITALAMDDKIVQISTDGSWSKIESSDGLQGYVRNDLLRETAPVTPFATTNRNQYITVSVSNIRATASTDSEVVGQVRQDEKILQIETDGSWSRIRTAAGVEGFVLNEFLTGIAPTPVETAPPPTNSTTNPTTNPSDPPAATTPAPTEAPSNPFTEVSGKVYVKVSAANLRAEPSTSSSIVGTLSYADAVDRIAANDTWTKIKTAGGQIGYLHSSLFQTQEISTADPAPPQVSTRGQQAADIARSLVGVPYVYGGASIYGVDCSGLVKYTYGQLGINLSHGSNSQARGAGYAVSFSNSNYEATLLPGDLLFFNRYGSAPNDNYTHVGIYLGNGQMVHAQAPGHLVKVVSLYNHYSPVRLAMRVFD